LDSEDIYLIAKVLDNITDNIEATAHRFRMCNVQAITDDARIMVKLVVDCTKVLEDVISDLENLGKSQVLSDKIIEVNRIEDDGDKVFRKAVTDLFAKETDAITITKWKEIYEYLENTLDACEDVANIVEGVLTKTS
jgi:uncharacterized protein Yka (UPF0111/DUF47 family)